MKLGEIFPQACPETALSPELASLSITGLETDSRAVEKGSLFIAIQGVKKDGAAFIEEAVARGAVAVLTDKKPDKTPSVPLILVADARLSAAKLGAAFCGNPSHSLKVIGITGTNGKTTSTYILEHLLTGEKKSTGVIGTVSCRFAGKEFPAAETTPGPLKIQKILSAMRDSGCEYAAMEVSSHALDQKRAAGIEFQTALFTNLTQDHLDYHGTMEKYFEAKQSLFSGLPADKTAVVNADDPWGKKILAVTRAKKITYAVDSPADLRAENIEFHSDSTAWDLAADGRKIKIASPLVGLHNVYNVLGVLGVLRGLGFSLEKAAQSLRSFPGVPGRLEAVEAGQSFKVYVDFAHTPDGLLNVLRALQDYRKKRLLLVFGCGGDRDRDKRPKMARIAEELSDFVYVTSDNPRSENPRAIAEEICTGFTAGFKNYAVVIDRRKAIRQAFLSAREGDIVLLAGKGHEKTQVIGSDVLPFSDRDEAEKVLHGR